MKKLFVAVLSIFVLLGAGIFTACGKEEVNLSLSQEVVAIEKNYYDIEGSYAIITAEVFNAQDASIKTIVQGDNVIVTLQKISSTKTNIKINALNEGSCQIAVRTNEGNVLKYIYVTVYSEVSAMEQKVETALPKNNFLVRGETNILDENQLIKFSPSENSRRDITWSLSENMTGLTIQENSLIIDENFDSLINSISLIATTERGISATIELPVIDKIEENISFSYSYSKNTAFETLTKEENSFTVVPNEPNDEKYVAYLLLEYEGNLNITGKVYTSGGNPTNDLIVEREDSLNGKPLFRIYANKDNSNINDDYILAFEIGYQEYNYAKSTLETFPLIIKAREVVNNIIISTRDALNIENSTQTLYTSYAESNYTTTNGQQFNILITPSTVIDASNKYSIRLSRTEAGGAVADGCPIEIWFRDEANGNIWTPLSLVEQANGDYANEDDLLPSYKTLYIKASESLLVQSTEGFKLTFTSEDNKNISTSFDLKLVKSVSAVDFVFEDADFKIDSSLNYGNVVLKKQFTLQGQTSTEGLYIPNPNTNYVTFDEIRYVSSDDTSVTFEVTVTLKSSSYGATYLDSYQIAHKNGLISEKFDIDIFLPLKSASVFLDSANNQSNSVIDYQTSKDIYTADGTILNDNAPDSIYKLMLKSYETTPLLYFFNSVNGKSAVASMKVEFFDFNEANYALDEFKALLNSELGIQTIINFAKNNINNSGVASFSADFSSLLTKGEGYTYAVITFTGKGADIVDANGQTSLVRILFIESIVTPEKISVNPISDRAVTLYSMDSLATSDEALTQKNITIKFATTGVTYTNITNILFQSNSSLMGQQTISGDGKTVTWANGRYHLSNVILTKEGLTFTINALDTYGEPAFYDTLSVHYVIYNDNYQKVYEIFEPITITINNAQRVESLSWKNYDNDGLYFEVGDTNPKYILVDIAPTNAKNVSLTHIITDESGSSNTTFVSVNDAISLNTLSVNLSSAITEGMTGYLYILPSDAINNGRIKYYYRIDENEFYDYVDASSLGNPMYSGGISYYQYLTTQCYFKSNATGGVIKEVGFADIICKIKITIADGRSFDYAYRIYDSEGLRTMLSDKYYTVMNSIDFSGLEREQRELNGGLQGYNDEVTIKLSGTNFASTIGENATIRNITFIGSVSGNGFVADTNNGTMANVIIDTNNTKASTLSISYIYGGGLVGENYGLISYCKVLGLNITSSFTVGGLVGSDAGRIEYSQFEIYNLESGEDGEGNKTYAPNKIAGSTVGGLVGNVVENSSIYKSFIYDYTLADTNSNLQGQKVGAIAGTFSGMATTENTSIDYSFAVVGIETPYFNYVSDNSNIKLSNYYIGYYVLNSSYEYNVKYVEGYNTNPNFIASGEGFDESINGGKAYLKELYQDARVASVNYNVDTYANESGYYKSVAVDSDNGILFYYQLKDAYVQLTSAENKDLLSLNTISISQLLGLENFNRNIIVTSSDSSIVKVLGSSLIIMKTGNVTLTLSSKQNVELYKEIEIKVVNAISDMLISWLDMAGNVNYVSDNSQLSLQKTYSRDYLVSYSLPQVYLGSLATAYQLAGYEDVQINIVPTLSAEAEEGQVRAGYEIIGNNLFKLSSYENSALTNFKVSPKLFNDEVYQEAIDNKFTREFNLMPVDGVINFALSSDTLIVTPSVVGTLQVEITTTADGDGVYPVINYNDERLTITNQESPNKYEYTFAKDVDKNTPILEAIIEDITPENVKTQNALNKTKVYTYNITFRVHESYKSQIPQDMEFSVYIMSTSGNSSKSWNGEFSLILSRQNFTNIDIQNRKIEGSVYKNNGETYVEVHTAGSQTSVLAPGNSSVFEINVNPEFAYYDYVDISYSGATVSNAVNIEVLKTYNGSSNEFVRREIRSGEIENIASSLRFTPTNSEKSTGKLYYKIWINSTVNSNSTIKFTATFYRANGELLSSVNYFLTISYLTEAKITVDGSDISYLAKGSSAQIIIDVLPDQQVDSLTLIGENVQGVSISKLSEPTTNEAKGIKTYTATLSASISASSNDQNRFYLQAQVSRELNGSKDIKNSIATVVIVDFKIDTSKITLDGNSDNNVTIWQGVPRALSVDYNLIPTKYNIPGDSESEKIVAQLLDARAFFETNQYYPQSLSGATSDYYINYEYNSEKELELRTIEDRLAFVINGVEKPVAITDDSIEKPFTYKYLSDSNKIIFTGTKISSPISMVLYTYISAGGYTQVIETYFTITVEAYSDPDLPLTISNASEFNALNPENASVVKANDYILKNDIVLTEYTPFDTSMIRSLDGNGYTIYIKSFNLTPEETSTLKLALFDEVKEDSTLKNIRVNLYNGGQITIDVSQYRDINIAGFAIENKGIITNCEVVSFYSDDFAVGETSPEIATTAHNKPLGINVTYVDGTNTTEEVYITDNSWNSQIAGFAIENGGNITNSRVGGDSVIILGSEKQIDNKPSGYTYASTRLLETFVINGQGNMAGFVLANAGGYIASSFVKNVDMENKSNSTKFYTSGFAGTNTSSILTSYVEGKKSETTIVEYSPYANEGSSLKSKMGAISGFIYDNSGSIKDSYSNIFIANSQDLTKVYLASGFVYINEGRLENCYSASQIANSRNTQMNFSGVNESGDLLMEGEYINCYFFNKAYYGIEDKDPTTETQYNTGAIIISDPKEASQYYGFAIADGENDGIWRIDEYGITLIEANSTTISHRYVLYVDESYDGQTAEDAQGKYILPYAVLTFTDSAREIDTFLGKEFNPILIASANDFVGISGTSQSSYIKQFYNNWSIWGSYRLVSNIDFSTLAGEDDAILLPSSTKAFSGRLYGNGFLISGISMSSEDSGVRYGLFGSIEKKEDFNPLITNVDIKISQIVAGDVAMVGGLAGYIKDAIIINIDIAFENNQSSINGLNFVGSLAGFAFGDNIIKNINITNPKVIAEKYSNEEKYSSEDINNNEFFTAKSLAEFRTATKSGLNYNTQITSTYLKSLQNYSFAGSVIGFADIYRVDLTGFDINQSQNFSINNIRISGRVIVEGQIAGGAFGLTGYQTNIRDIGLTVDASNEDSHIFSTKYFAGGLIGQSFGSLSRAFAVHDETTQDEIEDNMSNFYSGTTSVNRGLLNLFTIEKTNYTQVYIGGLIGYSGSGNLEIAYSKLNVTALSADYAGGIIGGAELSFASAYPSNNSLAVENAYTKYFINEVYASGDVRAKNFAGGLIGAIVGEGSRVALLGVNAFNYFTTYNYDFDNPQYGDVPVDNLSALYHVNYLVGKMIKDDGEECVPQDRDDTSYLSFLTLMQASETTSGSEEGSGKVVPSIGYYEGYYKTKSSKYSTLNLFGKVNGEVDGILMSSFVKYVYAITSPSLYATSSEGHTYTQEGFLNSGSWRERNWTHKMSDLFPAIKYKRTFDVVYLDCYNVAEVFKQMKGTNITVYVRGETSEGSEEYADINIDEYATTYGKDFPTIHSFSGKIKGGEYQTKKSGGIEDVKIISSKNFIESTAPGFSVSNLTVEYVGEKTTVSGGASSDNAIISCENGLFVNSEMTDSDITNLTLIIDVPVNTKTTINTFADYNVGLIAPVLKSTSISGLKIIEPEVVSTKAILTIDDSENYGEYTLYAGLIAGKVKQESTISVMEIENIEINTKRNLLSVSQSNIFKNYYLGGYFGSVERNSDAQELKLTLSTLKTNDTTDNAKDLQIMFNGESKNVTMGGYIGSISNTSIFTKNGEGIETNVSFMVRESNGTSLNLGGMFGEITSAFTFSAFGSKINSKLYVANGSLANLTAGGFTSSISGGTVKISNFDYINFEVVGGESTEVESLDKNKFNQLGDWSNCRVVEVSNEVKVGVMVGYANSPLDITGTQGSPTKLNSGYESIRVSGANKVYLGSILGYTDSAANIDDIKIDDIKINGNFISNANFVVKNVAEKTNVVGGVIGYLQGASGSSSLYNISDMASMLRYDGGVFSNSKDLIFGGIVGNVNLTNSSSALNIQNTSFGGTVKISGENSNSASIVTGGTIGKVEGSENTNGNVNLQNNYNYGDVFAEYDNNFNTALNTYAFGGLIGSLSSNALYDISSNYSIMTTHNARYSSALYDTVHALFGEGTPVKTGENFNSINYYSHSVSLAVDPYGYDIGYNSAYEEGQGYNIGNFTSQANKDVVDNIKNAVKLDDTFAYGHKLNPISISNTSSYNIYREDASKTNGLTYYYISNITNAKESLRLSETKFDLANIAIIGNAREISLMNTDNDATALVRKLSGHSFMSGFSATSDIIIEKAIESTSYAIVSEMTDNSILYAVNVRGSIEVGGSVTTNVSGLVGKMSGGKIYDCSTDIDIVYRAGANGSAFGIVELSDKTDNETDNIYKNKYIDNTYSTGSIKTLISANAYAFTNGTTANTPTSQISSCYTITKLDINDYTNSTNTASGTVCAFGGNGTLNNCYYDFDGIDYITSNEKGTMSKFSDIRNNFKGTYWTSDYDFNYGYPTLNYQYLKTSSYSVQSGKLESKSSGYDEYVEEYEYTRLLNGLSKENYLKKPESVVNKLFFIIPNAGVLVNINNISKDDSSQVENGLSKNFMLKYDIDLSNHDNNSEAYANATNKFKTLNSFTGRFDGQNHTIKGINNTLFETIGNDDTSMANTYIRNLRLTDAKVSGTSPFTSIITNATISNITLSGFISGQTGDNSVGGLANIIKGSEINTITNLIDITLTSNSNEENSVGGIAGTIIGTKTETNTVTITGTRILYCSNYGPISVTSSSNGKTLNVGGLVGFSQGAGNVIDYSYNATSVLGNYATTTALKTTIGTFRTGGLVGYVDNGGDNKLQITNSYNSGIIKSGNKSNSTKSYAGGIFGYAEIIKVYNCYNEGMVEALGKDPEWTFNFNADKTEFSLKVTSARNVWAYGVGYANDGSSIENSQVYLTSNELTDRDTIKSNGNVIDSNKTLQTYKIEDIDGFKDEYNKGTFIDNTISIWSVWTWPSHDEFKNKVSMNYSYKFTGNIQVLSVTDYNLPSKIVAETVRTITVTSSYGSRWVAYIGGLIPIYPNFSNTDNAPISKTVNEFNSFDTKYYKENNLITDIYEREVYSDDKAKISNIGSNNITIQVNEDIKKLMRSQVDDTSSIDKIYIAGKEYYLANQNNMTTLFNAGIYTYSDSLISNSLAFTGNKGDYKIDAQLGGEKINAKILNVNQAGEGTKIDYIISSTKEINGNLTIDVSVNYEKEITFNLYNLKYAYIDDYSFAIDLGFGSLETMTGYKLSYENGEYYKVVRLSNLKYDDLNADTSDDEPNNDFDDSFIYLAYGKPEGWNKETFIYIPNATLQYENKKGIVNAQYGSLSHDTFNTDVQSVIDKLTNQTWYYRVNSNQTIYKDLSLFTDYATGSKTFIAGESTTENGSLNYGKEISLNTSIEYNESEDKYILNINNISIEDIICYDNSNYNIILGYDASVDEWILNNDSLTIGDNIFDLSVNGNQIILSPSSVEEGSETQTIDNDEGQNINEIIETIKTQIQNYFESLYCIANDFTSTTINDVYDKKQNYTLTIGVGGEGKVTVDIYISKTFEAKAGEQPLTTSGFTIKASDNINQLSKFVFGDISVYKGTLNFTSTQSYSSTLGQVEIVQYEGKVYHRQVKIVLKNDSDIVGTIDTLLRAQSSSGDSFKDASGSTISHLKQGEYSINATFLSTYQVRSLSKNEDYDYRLVLENNGKKFYVEAIYNVDTSLATINTLLQSTTLTNNETRYVQQVYSEEEIENEGIKETKKYIAFIDYETQRMFLRYNITDNIYQMLKTENNELVIDDKGNLVWIDLSAVDFNNGQEIVESCSVNSDGTEITDIKYINTLKIKELIQIQDISSLLKINEEDNKEYLYIDGPYKVCNAGDDLNITIANETTTLKTQVLVNVYSYNDIAIPEYNEVEQSLSSAVSLDKLDITKNSDENFVYVNEGSNFIVILSGKDFAPIEAKLTFKLKDDFKKANNNKEGISAEEPLGGAPIILTQDISFNELSSLSKNENVNIIGNGYYISYYGDSFYQNVDGQNSFINNTIFLGETNGDSLLNKNLDNNSSAITINNVSLYGSALNIDSSTSALISGGCLLDNVKLYASIYGNGKKQNNSLTLLDKCDITNGINYGFISTKDGEHGNNGSNESSGTLSAGRDGSQGVSIQTTLTIDEDNLVTNSGIIKSGNGGNAGAGGNTNIGSENSAGKAGTKGGTGSITGFKAEANSIAIEGKEAKDGVKARAKVYGKEIYTTSRKYDFIKNNVWVGSMAWTTLFSYKLVGSSTLSGETNVIDGKNIGDSPTFKNFIDNYVCEKNYISNDENEQSQKLPGSLLEKTTFN